jgi:hypothetical protein
MRFIEDEAEDLFNCYGDTGDWYHAAMALVRETRKLRSLVVEVAQAQKELEIARAALKRLQSWDMLETDDGGRGTCTADAPWAKLVILEGLGLTK